MDIDFLKTISHEEHMEMVSMMMEINHFYGPHNNADGQPSSSEFSGQTSNSSAQLNLTKSFASIAEKPIFSNLSSTISFSDDAAGMQCFSDKGVMKHNSVAAMREMIFRMAAMQPVHIDPESVKPPKRRNVKISKDPQSVAARHRRERISERIRILQRLVPGGTKMDTASMLDEAIHYVKFLKTQVQSLEKAATNRLPPHGMVGFPVAAVDGSLVPHWVKGHQLPSDNVEQYSDA